MDSVRDMIEEDRRVSIRELSDWCRKKKKKKRTTIDVILKERLKMNKVCARWIPRILTDGNKKTRVSALQEFLRRRRLEGDQFLDKIVTTDETMISRIDPETKQESFFWKRTSSPPLRVSKSVRHVYLLHGPERGAAGTQLAFYVNLYRAVISPSG